MTTENINELIEIQKRIIELYTKLKSNSALSYLRKCDENLSEAIKEEDTFNKIKEEEFNY